MECKFRGHLTQVLAVNWLPLRDERIHFSEQALS